jgi:hypothetical protein
MGKQGLIYNCNLVQKIVMNYFMWAFRQHINMHAKFHHFYIYKKIYELNILFASFILEKL